MPEQHWTLHHVLLDRIDKESTEVTATADPPPIEIFQAFETLESGNAQFTISQLKAIRKVLAEYHHSPTWWEVERPQIEQLLHRITQLISQLQPALGGNEDNGRGGCGPMTDREEEMGRLAAREQQEQEEAEDVDTEQEDTAGASESADDTSQTSGGASTENASERAAVNVKDGGSNLFMYLPQSLSNDVDLACQSVNLTYQRESGEKLGKNRYRYPIVLLVGIDAAMDLSYGEIQDLVERIDAIENAG